MADAPPPWPVPPTAVGLVLWLFRAPAAPESLAAAGPQRVVAGDEAPSATTQFEALLAGADGDGATWAVELELGLLRELLQHLLGIPAAGARALVLDPGHAVQLRADSAGWTLERSNVPDPARAPAADLGDGIAE